MTMDDLVARCSKYSGYKLVWRIEKVGGTHHLVIEQPHESKSRLVLALDTTMGRSFGLRELHSRMHHWAITPEEEDVMEQALKDAADDEKELFRILGDKEELDRLIEWVNENLTKDKSPQGQ